jgi:xanthine/CO dehydrogenase XdhC/CoxF family maturation factor
VLLAFDNRKRFGCNGKIDILVERPSENFFADIATNLEARRCHIAVTTFRQYELVHEIHPPIRLIIFGDGPDSEPLRRFADVLGWETIAMVDAASMSITPDEWTVGIVKSHNYGRDFMALQRLLPMNLRYVGLIGPRKRRDQLLNDLLDLGITINAGFFAPAGLDLGSETPEEIALAVVSEIQRVVANGSGFSLRERKMPIHSGECSVSGR